MSSSLCTLRGDAGSREGVDATAERLPDEVGGTCRLAAIVSGAAAASLLCDAPEGASPGRVILKSEVLRSERLEELETSARSSHGGPGRGAAAAAAAAGSLMRDDRGLQAAAVGATPGSDTFFADASLLLSEDAALRTELLEVLETSERSPQGAAAAAESQWAFSKNLYSLGRKVRGAFWTGSMMASDAIWRMYNEADGEIRLALGDGFAAFRGGNFMTYAALVNLISRSGSMISSKEVELALQYFFEQTAPGAKDRIKVVFQSAPRAVEERGDFRPTVRIPRLLSRVGLEGRSVVLVPFVFPSTGPLSEAHIVMYGIDWRAKQVIFFDSKGRDNLYQMPFFPNDEGVLVSMEAELQALAEQLRLAEGADAGAWEVIAAPAAPIQYDSNNCGIHVIRALERMCESVSERRACFSGFNDAAALFGEDVVAYRSRLGSALVRYFAGEHFSGRYRHDMPVIRRPSR